MTAMLLGFLCVPVLMLLVGIPALLLIGSRLATAQTAKQEMEAAKLRNVQLRTARLERDLAVVENRAHLVASQEVLVGLRIEEKRKDLGLNATKFTPTNYGSDNASWTPTPKGE